MKNNISLLQNDLNHMVLGPVDMSHTAKDKTSPDEATTRTVVTIRATDKTRVTKVTAIAIKGAIKAIAHITLRTTSTDLSQIQANTRTGVKAKVTTPQVRGDQTFKVVEDIKLLQVITKAQAVRVLSPMVTSRNRILTIIQAIAAGFIDNSEISDSDKLM